MHFHSTLRICLVLIFCLNLFAQDLSQPSLQYLNSLPKELRDEILSKSYNQVTEKLDAPTIQPNQDMPSFEEEEEPLDNIQDKKFGFNFFENSLIQQNTTFEIPLVSDYFISVGDELELLLTGSKNQLLRLKVLSNGSVQIPEIGAISLQGLTLSEANIKLQQVVEDSYLSTKSSLNVTMPAMKKISIVGDVKKPGTYIVNPFTSVSGAIKYSKGLIESASLRNILIKHIDGTSSSVDLYNFLVFGDREDDISLRNGDTVVVNSTSNFFSISGEVHRPMQYEFKNGDKVIDLVKFAQGLTNRSDPESISLNYIDNNKILTKTVEINDTIGALSVESLVIPSLAITNNKDIQVIGSGVKNGFYKEPKEKDLSKFIEKLEFNSEIYPFFFTISQKNSNGLVSQKFIASLADPETYKYINILKEVVIKFYSRDQIENLQEDWKIKIDNDKKLADFEKKLADLEDKKDSKNLFLKDELEDTENDFFYDEEEFIFLKDNSLLLSFGDKKYLIPLAGQFTARSIINYLGEYENYISKDISFTSNEGTFFGNLINDQLDFKLGSVLTFTPLESIKLINVDIQGEVQNPGSYELNASVTLDNLYKIAGGLTENADHRGIVLSRSSIREKERKAYEASKKLILDAMIYGLTNNTGTNNIDTSILPIIDSLEDNDFVGRLSGDLSPNSLTATSLILEDKDVILIPPLRKTINIIGEVLSPSSIVAEDNISIEDYIDRAGGLTKFADRKNIYIVKSNGVSVKLDNSLFKRGYQVQPGDSIVVPRDLDKISVVPLVAIATKIISDISFAAASINSLSN